jgi:hypothetical protein
MFLSSHASDATLFLPHRIRPTCARVRRCRHTGEHVSLGRPVSAGAGNGAPQVWHEISRFVVGSLVFPSGCHDSHTGSWFASDCHGSQVTKGPPFTQFREFVRRWPTGVSRFTLPGICPPSHPRSRGVGEIGTQRGLGFTQRGDLATGRSVPIPASSVCRPQRWIPLSPYPLAS